MWQHRGDWLRSRRVWAVLVIAVVIVYVVIINTQLSPLLPR